MLVCNVALRARRTVAVEIIEVAGAAEDIPGVAGFALLVDEPAAANDTLSAFTGEVLKEIANATDSYTAGARRTAVIDEPASARDVLDAHAPTVYSVSITELASATDSSDGGASVAAGAYPISAARTGLGSTIIGGTGANTIIMTDLGAVS